MKIKFSLTLSAFMILINGAFSQNVPIITAQNVAKNFYFERAVNHNPTLRYANINLTNILTKTRGSNNIYYVFNVDSGRGWIVTAAQQNVVPILAFSTEGNFDTVKANQPPAFKYWMKNYESQINYAIDNNIQADSAISNKWTYLNSNSAINTPKQIQSVGPLLQTTWAQNCYYNAMCPVDNTTSCTGGGIPSPCGHVWVGCVAEAMGQVMKYWSYPETGTGSHIDATSYGNLYANFGTTIYAWPNMPNNVTSANTDAPT